MDVLVTGGAGFIGSNLALELEAQGHTVTVLDNFQSGHRENLQGFCGTVLESDLTETPVSGTYQVVFHHGDITDPRYEPQDQIFSRNTQCFQNVLDYCRRQRARLIYASTAGLYGNGPTPMKEDQPVENLTEYGRSKWQMDQWAASLHREMDIIGLRYFNVFGPREAHKGRPASMVYHLTQQIQAGKNPRLFEHGEQKRDFVYVKDCVEANLCALSAPSGIYNVGTGTARTFQELAESLLGLLASPQSIEYFPMPYSAESYQHHTEADLQLARTELHYAPRWEWKAALQDYLGWMGAKVSP